MLAFLPLPLTVLIASVRLFCLPCRDDSEVPFAQARQLPGLAAFLSGQRSLECKPAGSPFGSGFGLGPRDMSSNVSSSRISSVSCTKSGNLKVLGRGSSEEECRRSCPVVAWGAILKL